MKVELSPEDVRVVEASVAEGGFPSVDALVHELIERHAAERWIQQNREEIIGLVREAKSEPRVRTSIDDLRGELNAVIRQASDPA